MTRFDPAGSLRGSLTPPADKSISHRAAIIAAIGEGETAIENYLVAEDTLSTLEAIRALGCAVDRDADQVRVGGVGLARRLAGGDRRRQRGHPVAVAAGVARRAAAGRVEPRRRRLDPAPPGRSRGRAAAADGRRGRGARGPPRPADRPRRAAARDRIPASGRQRPGEVLRPARGPARRRTHERGRAVADSRPHRAHAGRRRGERQDRERRHPGDHPRRPAGPAGDGRAGAAARARRDHDPGRLLLRRLHDRRRAARPWQRGEARGSRHQPGPDRPARDPHPDGRRDRGDRNARRRPRAGGDDHRPLGAASGASGWARERCR